MQQETPQNQTVYTKCRIFLTGLLIATIVALSIVGVYQIYTYTSTQSLEGVADKLRTQFQQAVEGKLLSDVDDIFRSVGFLGCKFPRLLLDGSL